MTCSRAQAALTRSRFRPIAGDKMSQLTNDAGLHRQPRQPRRESPLVHVVHALVHASNKHPPEDDPQPTQPQEKPRKREAFRDGANGIRTRDLLLAKQALSQLSYGPDSGASLGTQPSKSKSRGGRCSNHSRSWSGASWRNSGVLSSTSSPSSSFRARARTPRSPGPGARRREGPEDRPGGAGSLLRLGFGAGGSTSAWSGAGAGSASASNGSRRSQRLVDSKRLIGFIRRQLVVVLEWRPTARAARRPRRNGSHLRRARGRDRLRVDEGPRPALRPAHRPRRPRARA